MLEVSYHIQLHAALNGGISRILREKMEHVLTSFGVSEWTWSGVETADWYLTVSVCLDPWRQYFLLNNMEAHLNMLKQQSRISDRVITVTSYDKIPDFY